MADFGAQLREARERKGISLRQIAAATKISVAALEALERNDISRLPGGIFSRAFVRSYAIEVGLDPDETVKKFVAHFSGEPAPVAGPPAGGVPVGSAGGPGQPSLGSVVAPPAAARAFKAVAARGMAAAPEGVAEEVEFESRQRMAAVVLKLVIISLPIALTILYVNSRATTPLAQEEEATPADAVEPDERSAPEPAQPEAPAMETAPTQTAGSTARPLVATSAGQGTDITIEIAPTSECWVQLTTDGTVALSRVLRPGERESHRFAETAVLQVGDAEACGFFINGRAARPLGRRRQVREVTITPDNYESFLAAGERSPGQ
jgi:cytoskeletal protein RodZ